MNDQIPRAFVFMRVGNHAGESFEDILERKRRELDSVATSWKIFWGYGGNTLHPTKHVQPFVDLWLQEEGSIQILMQPIDSKADPDILPAREYSVDGDNWELLPSGIVVTGSKYAIVLDEIKPGQLDLDLTKFKVGVGPSQGRNAADYLKWRVDKGCLVATQSKDSGPEVKRPPISIGFQARLLEPYAVFLRY